MAPYRDGRQHIRYARALAETKREIPMQIDTEFDNLVSRLRSMFTAYGETRSYTYLRESGRRLVEEVTSFRDLDRGAREVAAWLSARPEADRPVLLLFEPGVEFWRAFLGC